jgi:Competence protein CoiA-like family
MLIAVSRVTKTRVEAKAVDRSHPCECPECREHLVYKHGRIVQCHFAHKARTNCSLSAGETIRHLQMKEQMSKWFSERFIFSELEVCLVPCRRADIVLPGRKIVVECQHSPISIDEWSCRTADYEKYGYAVMWIWDIRRLFKIDEFPKTLDELRSDRGSGWHESSYKTEFRIPAEIRHADSYGHQIFALSTSGLLQICMLEDAFERYNDWTGYDRTPETLKRIYTFTPSGTPRHSIGWPGVRFVDVFKTVAEKPMHQIAMCSYGKGWVRS